jgi:hypothetical protein
MDDIKIGTQFNSPGKIKRICTVIDIYKTYNCRGELVKISYVAGHKIAGQTVIEYDIPQATIARNIIKTV